MLFSWMLIAPLLAHDADSNLPACCRRNGKHHCMMQKMQRPGSKETGFASVSEKCPCFPASTCAAHSTKCKAEAHKQFYAYVVSYPARSTRTEAHSRISSLRSHQRRGPPTLPA